MDVLWHRMVVEAVQASEEMAKQFASRPEAYQQGRPLAWQARLARRLLHLAFRLDPTLRFPAPERTTKVSVNV